MPWHVRGDVLRQEEIKQDMIRQRRVESEVTLPKINKKAQISERLMNWYTNDIPTMERKVANYKNIHIPASDPFVLFNILQQPSSNDLAAFCNKQNSDFNSSSAEEIGHNRRKSVQTVRLSKHCHCS